MKIQRIAGLTSICLAGAMALTACGSDNNTTSPASSAGSAASSAASSAAGGDDCGSGTLNAEGSSAQKNAFEIATSTFAEKCSGATVNYNPTGSGAGIKQFIAGQVAFAGSDSALKTKEKEGKIEQVEADKACGSPAWNIPMVTGPVAVSYNLPGVEGLVLNADTVAKIFSGQITKWNDPAIAKLNSGAQLPAKDIKVYFRSDESGTTENFTKYLKAAAPTAWTAEPGKKWTGKGEGKEKSAGVATAVKSTEGGITYAEWSYAKDNKLGIAKIDNGSGPVELTGDSAGKAVAAAKVKGEGNNLALDLDYATKEAGAYPIVLVTYEIVCSANKDAEKGKLIKSFLKHMASDDVQGQFEEIGYAPLPDEVQTKVDTAIDALK